jgi:hypothetical protein
MTPTEHDLEQTIIQYLTLHGCHVEKTDAGAVARRTKGQIKHNDLRSGCFDLTVLYRGMGFKLECKSPKRAGSLEGMLQQKQLLEKKRLDDLRVPNLICQDLKVLVQWLRINIPHGKWRDV